MNGACACICVCLSSLSLSLSLSLSVCVMSSPSHAMRVAGGGRCTYVQRKSVAQLCAELDAHKEWFLLRRGMEGRGKGMGEGCDDRGTKDPRLGSARPGSAPCLDVHQRSL